MLNENGGSRMETVVKLSLVFIISLLSFSIGTFVGKQFSDQQYKTASLEHGNTPERSTASIAPNHLDVKPEKALTEADIASISEDFASAEKDDIDALLAGNTNDETTAQVVEDSNAEVSDKVADSKPNSKLSADEKIEAMLAESKATEHAEQASESMHKVVVKENPVKTVEMENTNAADVVTQTAEALAKNIKPIVKQKPETSRIPTSLPATLAASSVGKFTVQIASYQKEEDAKAHSERLTKQGYSAFYLNVQIKGAAWYRVNVGVFADHEKANVFRNQLMKEANLKSALVQKIIR